MSKVFEFKILKTHEIVETKNFRDLSSAAKYAQKLTKKHKVKICAFGFFSF